MTAYERARWLLLARRALAMLFFAATGLLIGLESATADDDYGYDHETTTIPTEGGHRGLACEACHPDDNYETTPTQCQGCHDGKLSMGMPSGHIPVAENCDQCHSTTSFRIPLGNTRAITFDHDSTGFPLEGSHRQVLCTDCHRNQVYRGTPSRCQICHDGIFAPGKPADHLHSTLDCSECHNTWTFSVARINHFLAAAPCVTCHNSHVVSGKSATHIASSNNCEACHRTLTWIPLLRMDHGETIGECFSCHNQSPGHIPTTNNCDACHGTSSWLVNTRQVDHNEIPLAQTQCAICHEADRPRSNHPRGRDCILCHVTPPIGDWCSQPVADRPGLCE